MTIATIVSAILQQMPKVTKWQKKFIVHILPLFMGIRGKVNMKQMSRYGSYNETTYHNQLKKPFDYLQFNQELIAQHGSGQYLLVFDPSYLPKSGKKTPNVGSFWSGCAGAMRPGLELGIFSIVDIELHTGFHLEAEQTPNTAELGKQNQSLLGHYIHLCVKIAKKVEKLTRYLVVDAFFSKREFVNAIVQQTKLHVIGRLRDDASLRYLYTGPRNLRGRPKQYDGTFNLKNIDKERLTKKYEDAHKVIWDIVVNYPAFQMNLRIAYVEFKDETGKVTSYKAFFATDLQLGAVSIFKSYKLRFQIEFEIRDAKQFTGLADCQSTDAAKMDFHVNTALTAVSVAKAAYWCESQKQAIDVPFSMANVKTLIFNQLFLEKIFSLSGIDAESIQKHPEFHKLLTFGAFDNALAA
jgi:uncharacterized protein with NAD-binding domain and iron-sulfur cluster